MLKINNKRNMSSTFIGNVESGEVFMHADHFWLKINSLDGEKAYAVDLNTHIVSAIDMTTKVVVVDAEVNIF